MTEQSGGSKIGPILDASVTDCDNTESGSRVTSSKVGEHLLRFLQTLMVVLDSAEAIDTILVWRDNPTFSAITAQWYEEAASKGDVRIYKRREEPAP